MAVQGPVNYFIKGAQRMAYPGVYKRPDQLVAEAADLAATAPETGAMQRLFGVNRDDLYNLSLTRGRGPAPSVVQPPQNARGAAAAEAIKTPQNTQRIIDILTEAGKRPELYKGMDSWYESGPLYDRLVNLVGEDKALNYFNDFNRYTGMASSNSDVLTELTRGSAANYLARQGRFGDFVKYGGKSGQPGAPADIANVPGHMVHSTAHAKPMSDYNLTGSLQMKSPKVPVYIQSSSVDEAGRSWGTPVGDAHWSRGVGLADTRNPKTIKGQPVVPGQSVSTPELNTVRQWWENNVARQVGLEAVPAQARLWGAASRATGVDTAVGKSKLELLSEQVAKRADNLGVDENAMLDYILVGGDLKALNPKNPLYKPFFAAAAAGAPIGAFADVNEENRIMAQSLPGLLKQGGSKSLSAKEQADLVTGNVRESEMGKLVNKILIDNYDPSPDVGSIKGVANNPVSQGAASLGMTLQGVGKNMQDAGPLGWMAGTAIEDLGNISQRAGYGESKITDPGMAVLDLMALNPSLYLSRGMANAMKDKDRNSMLMRQVFGD